MKLLLLTLASSVVCVGLAPAASSQVLRRVSVGSSGSEGNQSSFASSMTPDGRYVLIDSYADNLVSRDSNQYPDVFVRDLLSGTTERVSVGSSGAQANGTSWGAGISEDGRFVGFGSTSANLVDQDTNHFADVFVKDRWAGSVERVSVSSTGEQANDDSAYYGAAISGNGRFVAFASLATNLVPADTNAVEDIFVHDRLLGTTSRASVDSSGNESNGRSHYPVLSRDGRYVAFHSRATNLVPGSPGPGDHVFVHDTSTGVTELIDVDPAGAYGNGFSGAASISADGRFVLFSSNSSDLVAGDTNGSNDVFVRDRQLGVTERVNVSTSGAQTSGVFDGFLTALSTDGRFVVFVSDASDVVPGDTNAWDDVFLRDRLTGTTERLSLTWDGQQIFLGAYASCQVSTDGRFVQFSSDAKEFVPDDDNHSIDAFVVDRTPGASLTSLCIPGTAGIVACPCQNPPASLDRGCDNSAATGGASMSASGGAFLSSDTLIFTSSGEPSTAASLLFQGTISSVTGATYGQGVRCAGGALRRLYSKAAAAGETRMPDRIGGDRSVSAQSAAKGEVIQSGQSRWYFVAYRDPVVLGGCSAASTFNATQVGRVDWNP